MATGFLSPIGSPTQQFFTDQGVVLAGGLLYTYLAGTTTPAQTYTTSSLSVANPNPIVLDSAGRPPQEIWLQQGTVYKFVVHDSTDSPVSVATFDNISGINDVSNLQSVSEWQILGSTPTFINGTQFSVPGNQTATLSVNRRIYATVTAGIIYGTITTSAFGAGITTVTVAWDSGAVLDSGLSNVAYGILNPTNPSYLSLLNVQTITASGTYTPTPGTVKAIVELVGGGGGGGGAPATGAGQFSIGSGGGAGAYIKSIVSNPVPTTITIGAAGSVTSGNNGGTGGSTSYGTLLVAGGGVGGSVSGPSNAVGAVGGIGGAVATAGNSLNLHGGQGGSGAGTFGAFGITGNGASSPLGSGGGSQVTANTAGLNAQGFGSGGGGAFNGPSNGGNPGGTATAGVVVIYEYV